MKPRCSVPGDTQPNSMHHNLRNLPSSYPPLPLCPNKAQGAHCSLGSGSDDEPKTSRQTPEQVKERSYRSYDILEVTVSCISHGQILLSIAFVFGFVFSPIVRCTLSQYHLRLGLNLWLTAGTGAVLTFAVMCNYFASWLSGILRLLLLGLSCACPWACRLCFRAMLALAPRFGPTTAGMTVRFCSMRCVSSPRHFGRSSSLTRSTSRLS
jgi:hypothetical protein